MEWINNIKVMIFDLDGTLYQDYKFLKQYLKKMFAATHTEEEVNQIIQESYDLLTGNKEIKLGFFYDEQLNFFAYNQLKVSDDVYGELTYIGDPWSIATYMAKREKLDSDVMKRAFDEVRREMLTHEDKIAVNAALVERLQQIDCYKILMTNTALPSGEEFVSYLGLTHCFDEIYYDGKKPNGMQQLLQQILDRGYKPEQIMSFGDHPFNDLHPLHALGGYTCLISKYPHEDATEWSKKVSTIDELSLFLQLFQNSKENQLEVVKGG